MRDETSLELLLQGDAAGLRLELFAGLPVWESHPVVKHQRAIDRIRSTIAVAPGAGEGDVCGCVHLADVYVRFPDGSLTRPDVSIFCREPDEEEEAVRLVPEAVIEVVSRGFEAKDMEIGPRFYLAQGVKDIVVFDPRTLLVLHIHRRGAARHVSPVTLHLACGCTVTV